jgi:DHA2 family multidrug resistance protein-like MFS transporter
MLYSMDLTVLNLAVPSLSADLKPSSAELLWIVDIYGFLVAGSLITMGTLGDRIGRRKLLLIGAAVFGAASVLAAFSTSAPMLIATRALQGIAAATLAPSTLSLIRNMFHDPAQRTVAISVWVMSFSAGAAIGPVIGGVLLEHFRWGSVFLINVPVMLALIAIGPVLLPEFRDPDAGRLDPASAVQSLAAVLAVIYGLKRIAEGGLGWIAALSVLAGVAVGVAFLRRQGKLADPLIDLKLFRFPAFRTALLVNILGFMTAFATFLFIAQYLQSVLGLSPLTAGLWGVPSALAFIAGSMLTPAIVGRFHPAHVIAGGMTVSSAGFVLLALIGNVAPALAILVAGSVVFSLGLTPVVTLTTDIVLSAAPPERAGAASALSETSREHRDCDLSREGRRRTARGHTGGGRRGGAKHDRRGGFGFGAALRHARRRSARIGPGSLRASVRNNGRNQRGDSDGGRDPCRDPSSAAPGAFRERKHPGSIGERT